MILRIFLHLSIMRADQSFDLFHFNVVLIIYHAEEHATFLSIRFQSLFCILKPPFHFKFFHSQKNIIVVLLKLSQYGTIQWFSFLKEVETSLRLMERIWWWRCLLSWIVWTRDQQLRIGHMLIDPSKDLSFPSMEGFKTQWA